MFTLYQFVTESGNKGGEEKHVHTGNDFMKSKNAYQSSITAQCILCIPTRNLQETTTTNRSSYSLHVAHHCFPWYLISQTSYFQKMNLLRWSWNYTVLTVMWIVFHASRRSYSFTVAEKINPRFNKIWLINGFLDVKSLSSVMPLHIM